MLPPLTARVPGGPGSHFRLSQNDRSLTEGLHTDGPMGTPMITIMAAFAQLERDTMIERTRAGLAAAVANGRKGGRRGRSTTPMPRRPAA
jgi:DNA invertase Pin-like site-specific DNA recombinase